MLTGILGITLGLTGFAQEDSAGYPKPDEIRARYGFAEWAGATGPVWAGISNEALEWKEWAPAGKRFLQLVEVREQNPYEETPVVGPAIRIDRMLVHKAVDRKPVDPKSHHFRVQVTGAQTREAARLLLLNEFLTHHSVPPAAAPALPWGEVRVGGIGDVAFAHQKHTETHRLVFVRGNHFVRIDALGIATASTLELGRAIDAAIQKSERASTYDQLTLPTPKTFTIESTNVAVGRPVGLEVELRPGQAMTWSLPHGDLVRDVARKGDYGYVPRETGPMGLVVVDERGAFQVMTHSVTTGP